MQGFFFLRVMSFTGLHVLQIRKGTINYFLKIGLHSFYLKQEKKAKYTETTNFP